MWVSRVLVQEGKIYLRSKLMVLAWSPGRIPQDSFCFSFQFALGWGLLALDRAGGSSVPDRHGGCSRSSTGRRHPGLSIVLMQVPAMPALSLRMFHWGLHTGPQLSYARMAWLRIL